VDWLVEANVSKKRATTIFRAGLTLKMETASFSETLASINRPHGDLTEKNMRIVTAKSILNLTSFALSTDALYASRITVRSCGGAVESALGNPYLWVFCTKFTVGPNKISQNNSVPVSCNYTFNGYFVFSYHLIHMFGLVILPLSPVLWDFIKLRQRSAASD
jgi:hypothetical protein